MSLDVYLVAHCAGCAGECDGGRAVYTANVTHNLNRMAEEAGIYGIVWRPEENGIATAGQLVTPLSDAIDAMRADPSRFHQFTPPNGWGTFSDFVPWLERYRDACREYPDAKVRASR